METPASKQQQLFHLFKCFQIPNAQWQTVVGLEPTTHQEQIAPAPIFTTATMKP